MPTIRTILPQQKNNDVPLLRVAAYCRVSSDSDDQMHSFGVQTEYYKKLIGENPLWTLADIYADEGITGISRKKRDEFNRMLADCKRGRIDRILTKSVSRFARNTVDCLDTVRMLSGLGISVLFEKEQIDTAKMSSEVILGMISTQAQDESVSISGNMKWSYEKRMKNGTFTCCRPPLGYDLINGKLVVNPHDAEIIRNVFEMFLSGIGRETIARYLNDIGVPNPSKGKKWRHCTVDYLLKNEKYIGDALLQKQYTTSSFPSTRKRNFGQRTQYYVENSHEPIISRDTFNKVQQLIAKNTKEWCYHSHPLTGLLRCPHCGCAFCRIQSANEVFWRCASRNNAGSKCPPLRVVEADVKAALLRAANTLILHYQVILAPAIQALEQLHTKSIGEQARLLQINSQISSVSTQIHTLTQLQTQGILDACDFAEQNRILSDKLSKLRSDRYAILRAEEYDESIAKMRELSDLLEDQDHELEDFDESFLRELVERVVVESNTALRIYLPGGIMLPERMPETKRRYKRL